MDKIGNEDLNAQLKKGVLESTVLISVTKKDIYGYELASEVPKVIDVNEGIIYPPLKRLTNEHYLEMYLEESTEGPPREHYHLTTAGVLYKDNLKMEWEEFHTRVDQFIVENSLRMDRGKGLYIRAGRIWKGE